MRYNLYKRPLALLLCVLLFLGRFGAAVYAEGGPPDAGASGQEGSQATGSGNAPGEAGTITVTAFDELGGGVKVQSVPLGTPQSGLILPATLGTSGYMVLNGTEPAPGAITITGVTWQPTGENNTPAAYEDGRTSPCRYYFQPILPKGYTLADGAALPKIEVRYGWGTRARSSSPKAPHHAGDVAAFKEILAAHPELKSIPGVDAGDPATWGGVLVGWDATTDRLTSLYLNNKGLVGTLDASGLPELVLIRCFDNPALTGLKLGALNRLTDLHGSNTGISGELDVSQCPELKRVWCNETPNLTGLKLGQHHKLTDIQCNISAISGELDVSGCSRLVTLGCSNTPALTGLKLGTQNNMVDLKCNATGIKGELDVSNCPRLGTLWCHDNPSLTALRLGKKAYLTRFRCSFTGISGTLDVSEFPRLISLWCSDNPALTGLKLGTQNHLADLFCSTTGIKGTLDVSQCPQLQMLFCSDNPDLTGLKLGAQSQLLSLLCAGSGLSGTLDVSDCPQLKTLSCFDNQLEALDVSGTALEWLDCYGNPLAALTAKDGKTLTVGAKTGGKAYITDYTPPTNSAQLTAAPGRGYTFKEWTGLPAGAANTETTSFALSGDYHVSAVFDLTASSGGTSGNHESTSRRGIALQPPKPDNPVLAVIELPVAVRDGAAAGKPDDGRTAAALADAGKKAGAKHNGIAVRYDAQTSLAYDGFSITMERATLGRLITAGVKYVTLNTGIVDLTFDLAALREIAAQSIGDITLAAARETALSGAARAAVGSRPAYRLTVRYAGKDGRAATVQDFGAGRATVGLAYTPAGGEQAGGLYLVHGKENGGVSWFTRSVYDGNSGNVAGKTGHFSLFGVGYQPAPVFSDTADHPAEADMDFAASRGLLAGSTAFAPEGAVTRGALVMALGKLAGVDVAAYPSCRFTDVPAACAPYAQWAAAKGIVTGSGKRFSPDAVVTREQMALYLQRYAKKLGIPLPVARTAERCTDEGEISGDAYLKAIWAVQQAGVMGGKGRRFAPRDAVTRAEAAAVLRRFVLVVTDRSAAQDGAGASLN